jgi:methionyl-tRNA formyltransferase
MENKKVLLLLKNGFSSNVIFNTLNEKFNVSKVIVEAKEKKSTYLKRRFKKIGFTVMFGQVMFKIIAVPILKYFSKRRIQSYLTQHKINFKEISTEVIHVSSVNSDDVIELISRESPDVIVINGTSIISKKVLSTITCPVINMHGGITPIYRGVYGGYWSIVNKDEANCGVTIHLVDEGIDTGNVLYQSRIEVSPKDNFAVYPVKQMIQGLPYLIKAVDDALSNNIKPLKTEGKSSLWKHPTLAEYLYNLIFKGVK